MERLWSLAGATGRNRWQMRRPRKLQKQAKTVAVGCHRLRPNLDGKEVNGSSPLEGFRKGQEMAFFMPANVMIVVTDPVPKTWLQRYGVSQIFA